MKRLLSFLLIFCLLFSLCACAITSQLPNSGTPDTDVTDNTPPSPPETEDPPSVDNITGNDTGSEQPSDDTVPPEQTDEPVTDPGQEDDIVGAI